MFPKTNFLFVPVIQGQRPIVCQFEPPIQDKMHVKPEVWQMGLTHLPLDKMAAILADDIFNCFFLYENDRIQIQISLKYVPRSPIDNMLALVQVMAWCRTGDESLPEPMMTQLIDAYMRH